MVPLGIGLLGLLLGAIALFMSLSNSSKIAGLPALSDSVAAAAKASSDAKAEADGLASKVDANTAAISGLRDAAQTAFNQVKDAIGQLTTEVAAMKSSGGRAGGTARSGGATETSTAVAGQGGIHVVASGDNLSKIATKYGVTLKEIEDANPGVDSNHLRIGQKITIPAARSGGAPRGGSTSTPAPATSATPATAVAP